MYTAKMVPNKDREKRRRRKLKKRELAAQQEQEKQGSTSSSDQSITDSSQTEKEQQQSSGSNSNTLTGDSGSCVSDTTSHTEDLKATQQSAEKVKSEEQKLDDSDEIPDEFKVLAVVKPKRGRLLIFPHLTPHEGREGKRCLFSMIMRQTHSPDCLHSCRSSKTSYTWRNVLRWSCPVSFKDPLTLALTLQSFVSGALQ